MTRYTIDSDAVSGAASAITGTVARMQTEVQTMHNQLDALQGSWTGQASVAFQGVVQRWRTTQATVEQVLQEIDRALRQANEQYVQIELANARMFA